MADYPDLIAAIYDAIIEPSGWDEVVKRIIEATKSVSGGLFMEVAGAPHLPVLHNIDPFYATAYVQTWHKHNPLLVVGATMAPGELRTGTQITQTDLFKASAFFNEYFRPQGWADAVAIGLLRRSTSYEYLVLQRSADAVWVEPEEWHFLETLAPHLKRVAELHQLFSGARATTDSLGAAVAAAGFAVFLLTGDCRVAFANPKADDLLRRGTALRYERGQLVATSAALTPRLHARVGAASRPVGGEGDIGGTLELSRGDDRPPLLAHIIPLAANRAALIFDFDQPTVALFVVDPTANLNSAAQHFGASFGLTGAETRVLVELIRGNGLLAAATKLKITEATARTHTKHILAKTETTRQTQLIRRFFETAFPSSPGGA